MTLNFRQGMVSVSAFFILAFGAWCAPDGEDKPAPRPPQAVVDELEICINKLGDESFRVRRQASKRILEIGSVAKPDGADCTMPYMDYVRERLTKLYAHSDPEVSQRARSIVDQLFPTPRLPLPNMVTLPHFVDQQNDTLEIVAEMYGSRIEWIKAANPKIRNDKDLRAVKEVSVPVEGLSVE